MTRVAPGSDLLRWTCSEGHDVIVSEHVWDRFDRHGCKSCRRTYTRSELLTASMRADAATPGRGVDA